MKKLRESVKNMENKFDTALGFDEQTESDEMTVSSSEASETPKAENSDEHTETAEQMDSITPGSSKTESECQTMSTKLAEIANPNDETLCSITDSLQQKSSSNNIHVLMISKDPTDGKKDVTAHISKESAVQENIVHENDKSAHISTDERRTSDSRVSSFRFGMPLAFPPSSFLLDLEYSDHEGSPVQSPVHEKPDSSKVRRSPRKSPVRGHSKRARMEGEDDESASPVDDLHKNMAIKDLMANAASKLQAASMLVAALDVKFNKLTRSRKKHRTQAKKSAAALKVVQDKNKELQLSIEELDLQIKAKGQEMADMEETNQRDFMQFANKVAARTWVLCLVRLKVHKHDSMWLPTSVPWAFPDDPHDIDLFDVKRSLVKEQRAAWIAANASAQAQHGDAK